MEFDTLVNIPFQDANNLSDVYTVDREEMNRIGNLWRVHGLDHYNYPDDIVVNCYKVQRVREDDNFIYHNVDHGVITEFPLNKVNWIWITGP